MAVKGAAKSIPYLTMKRNSIYRKWHREVLGYRIFSLTWVKGRGGSAAPFGGRNRMEDIEPALESLHENAAYPALTGNEVNCAHS